MSKPYDATGKMLLDLGPAGWLEFLGVPRPAAAVTVIDAELSTVTTAADKVVRVADPAPWLMHLEFQADKDASLPVRLLKYNSLLQERHGLPVATAVVLLDRKAKRGVTGSYRTAPPFGPAWTFRYTVVRVWELPPGPFLAGPLAVLPLAPVANVPRAEVPGVVRRVGERLGAEANPATAGLLWQAMGILLSLRYKTMTPTEWLREIPAVDDIPLFRAMQQEWEKQGVAKGRAEGRAEGLRTALLGQGRKQFGSPSAKVKAAVNAVTDPARLEALLDRLSDVSTWDDLLAAP